MIHIANIKGLQLPLGERQVYVGRAVPNKKYRLKASPLANPYKVGPFRGHTLTHEAVVDLFSSYLPHMRRNGSSVGPELQRIAALARTGDVWLVCWCAPKRCHAEMIRDVVEEMLS